MKTNSLRKNFSKILTFLCVALVFALTVGIVSACTVEKQYDQGLIDSYRSAKANRPSQSGDSQSASDTGSSSGGGGSQSETMKEVKETLNINEYSSKVGKITEDIVKGVWTIQTDAEMRSRSKSWTKKAYADYPYLNTENTLDGKSSLTTDDLTYSIKLAQKVGLKVSAPGDGYVCVYIQNGSSGATEQIVTVNGTEYKFPGTSDSSPVVQLKFDVEAGKEYVVARPSGTVDLFYAELYCLAEEAEATGISVQTLPKVSYIAGMSLDTEGLVIAATYANGTAEALKASDYTLDTSAVDIENPGTYTVGVTYNANTAFTTSFDVVVSALDRIELGMNATEKLATNSKAGNGVYYNYKVKTVYGVNNTLNTDHLTVMAYNDKGELFSFKNNNAAVSYSGYDMATTGKKAVTVTLTLGAQTATATYEIYVIDDKPTTHDGTIHIAVDQNTSVIGGHTYNEGSTVTGTAYWFKTIGSALEFIKLNQNTIGDLPVEVSISTGTYKEKLEIESPNITFSGMGNNAKTTVIEWNSLYGVNDESGFSGVTDSVFTVALRDAAENVTMKNLTISNYWNSKARFNERADSATCDHRALALLVQSDKFVMDGCRLLGYQDTVEFFTGRQYLKNCYVSGCTDFIFGTNGTTYFENCEIHSVEHVKADNGYLTAMKGCNKGDADAIKYGVIFDKCSFTADSGVNKGGTAVGRCWDKYAAVAVINSTMGEHMSTTPYADSGKGFRYIAMNAKPTASTVQFVEFNNTGDGAVDHKIDGMSEYLTATAAANYSDMSVIFGTTNGKLTYSSAWNPKG